VHVSARGSGHRGRLRASERVQGVTQTVTSHLSSFYWRWQPPNTYRLSWPAELALFVPVHTLHSVPPVQSIGVRPRWKTLLDYETGSNRSLWIAFWDKFHTAKSRGLEVLTLRSIAFYDEACVIKQITYSCFNLFVSKMGELPEHIRHWVIHRRRGRYFAYCRANRRGKVI